MNKLPLLSAEFLCSAATLAECPNDEVVEIAFVGRSNAGKSSSLNRIMGNKKLAYVSKTPGRTRLINLFATSFGIRVVDLPGYGYAKASRTERLRWNATVDAYLEKRTNLSGLAIVMDARHPLKPFDQGMLEWAYGRNLRVLLLMNKVDKLKRQAQMRSLAAIRRLVEDRTAVTVQLFSAASGQGRDEVIKWLGEFA